MSTTTHYNVIIAGPGRGTLAYRLASSGKNNLLLEWSSYLGRLNFEAKGLEI